MNCHRTDIRPNWEAFNQWPGAYGGNNDSPDTDPTIQQSLQDFIKNAPNDPRFSQLPGLADGYTTDQTGKYTIPRNAMLSLYASRWNFERVARIIQSDPNYATYKYALIGLLFCAGPASDFYPNSLASSAPAVSGPLPLSNLQFLFPDLDFADDLSTGFLRSAPIQGFQTPGNAALEFTGKLIANDPSLQVFFTPASESLLGMSQSAVHLRPSACSTIKNASVTALSIQAVHAK